MALESICTPALIYLVFSIVQIVLDTGKGLYNTAFLKLFVTFIFTIFLNYLCDHGLGVISWIIVFIPFILMSIIISVLLLMLGLDPTTGKLKINGADVTNKPQDPRKIPIDTVVAPEPAKKHTGSSLLKHLEDELNTVADDSPYDSISNANKPYSPTPPTSSPYPAGNPYPPIKPSSPYPPPMPNPYNVKNTAPFVNDSEQAVYNKLTPENKKIFDNLPTNSRQQIDMLYLMFKPNIADINNYPADKLNAEFIKNIKENNI